jgi:glycerol-3-phosphate acyltransferase PlsY
VILSDYFTPGSFSGHHIIHYNVICACAAVLGHVYPLFAGFKGGKGVATLTGIMFALLPWETAAACVVFVIILLITCYVSLSSIMAAISFPLIVAFLPNFFLSLPKPEVSELIFATAIAVFIPIVHLKNIRRLFNGEEKKLFRYKKK